MTKRNIPSNDRGFEIDLAAERASAVAAMLTHLFGGDSSADKPGDAPGAALAIQSAASILRHLATTAETCVLPLEQLQHAQHAAALADLVSHLVEDDGFDIRFADRWLAGYFGAIEWHLDELIAARAAACIARSASKASKTEVEHA